jgi:hypothetical protein
MKYVCFLLSLVILLQGCTVYRKWTISLESAAKTKSRVKVVTVDGETWKFRKVLAREEGFYGVKKVSGDQVLTPLNPQNIKGIHLKNRELSFLINYTLISVPIGILLLILIAENANFYTYG